MFLQPNRAASLVEESAADGAQLLDDIQLFFRRFCAFPNEHCLVAVVLWAAHSHMVEYFHTTPRLAVLSPEVASGKTRVLEVLDLVVRNSLFSVNASPAAIFRTLDKREITLLFDEVDTIWRRRGKDGNHEDLRALLNAGYRRGAMIPRCVGSKFDVVSFPVFCPVALAGLGHLPPTIMSRSIVIRMRRRAPNERIEAFRLSDHELLGHELRDRLAAWAEQVGVVAGDSRPNLPPGVEDRPAEVWEPLVAVADVAGGDWPAHARAACIELCKRDNESHASLGIRLLSDLRVIFGDADAMHSCTLVHVLVSLEDSVWANLHGKPLTQQRLASMLRKYEVTSTKVRAGPSSQSLQGYKREDLWDLWVRYLPSGVAGNAEHSERAEQKTSNVPIVPDVPPARQSRISSSPVGDKDGRAQLVDRDSGVGSANQN